MDIQSESSRLELLCVRPFNEPINEEWDKQEPPPEITMPPRTHRAHCFTKRLLVSVICFFMMVSAPTGLREFANAAAGNTEISKIFLSLESGAHGDIGFNLPDFFAFLTASRLLSDIKTEFNSEEGTKSGENNGGTEPAERDLFDVPINQGTVKSTVPRIDTHNINIIEPTALTINPTSALGYDFLNGIFIQNGTYHSLDIASLLSSEIELGLKTSSPTVLIIHTHTSEAYTPTALDEYETEANDRCGDINYSVVRVGAEIKKVLEKNEIGVLHVTEFFDSPAYSGAYGRSLAAVEKYLTYYPSIKVVLDIHRDALNSADSPKYKLISDIDGSKAAQIMMVIGTDASGDNHPYWKENLKLAVKVQNEMVQNYPTLARPLKLTNSSYNQFVSNGAMIVEVGANGNSLEEAIYGGKLFAGCLSSVLLSYFE